MLAIDGLCITSYTKRNHKLSLLVLTLDLEWHIVNRKLSIMEAIVERQLSGFTQSNTSEKISSKYTQVLSTVLI
jgi:hypothetical protein